MRIDIMTLFPETVGDMMNESILGRAQERDFIKIECHQIRDYTTNKQNQVDDYPYGGGHGAVLQADPLFRCWEHICQEVGQPRVHTIYMSPCGKTFCQADAKRLAREFDNLILVCGHYEGIDERFIEECVDEEMSLGDFVLTGGEYAAMAIADAVCRLCPGVLSTPECYENESHWDGLLEYPQYSRPTNGTAGRCRIFCCLGITPTSPSGGERCPCAGQESGGRICMPSWIYPLKPTRNC